MIECGQCKVKCYQHIQYSGNWGRNLDNELLQWEHSRLQTTSNYTSAACGPAALFIFNLSWLLTTSSTHKRHDFTMLPFLCLLFHRQRQSEGGLRKEKLMDKALVIQRDFCFKLSKSQCSVKGQFYISLLVSTGEANRRFMFAVKGSFFPILWHQLHFLFSSDLVFSSETADRSEMSIVPLCTVTK